MDRLSMECVPRLTGMISCSIFPVRGIIQPRLSPEKLGKDAVRKICSLAVKAGFRWT